MKLPQPILKFFKFIVFLCRVPSRLSQKLHEAINDWAEMAPYRIRLMAQSFGTFSTTGASGMNSKSPFDPSRYRDDFTRHEMIIWRFIDYDRMMFGKNDPITARQWLNLGDLYWEHRKPGEAAVFYRKGLKILQSVCANTDELLISAQKKMANCYLLIGDYVEAEKLLNAIAIAIDAKQGPRSELITNLIVLAETLKKQEKFSDAARALNTIVDLHEADGDLPGEECLAIYRELSETYTALGDPEKAELFIATAKQLDFMRIVESAVGQDGRSLIRELEPLAALYLRRNKTAIVKGLKKRIEICELVYKVKTHNYPGIERDLERLAVLIDERNQPGDATTSFHLRARAKRLLEEANNKLYVFFMIMSNKLYWLFEAIEGSEALIYSFAAMWF